MFKLDRMHSWVIIWLGKYICWVYGADNYSDRRRVGLGPFPEYPCWLWYKFCIISKAEYELSGNLKKNTFYYFFFLFQSRSDALDEFYGVKLFYIPSQTGFIFQLKRRWTRYIFIYYVPSALCVITSWVSFLISPQVSTHPL